MIQSFSPLKFSKYWAHLAFFLLSNLPSFTHFKIYNLNNYVWTFCASYDSYHDLHINTGSTVQLFFLCLNPFCADLFDILFFNIIPLFFLSNFILATMSSFACSFVSSCHHSMLRRDGPMEITKEDEDMWIHSSYLVRDVSSLGLHPSLRLGWLHQQKGVHQSKPEPWSALYSPWH